MQAKKKPGASAPESRPSDRGAPLSGVSATEGDVRSTSVQSPARALQMRLAREISAPQRAWLWHTTGLVLALILSLSLAGAMLGSGV